MLLSFLISIHMKSKDQLLMAIIDNLTSPEKEKEFVRVVLTFKEDGRPEYLKRIK